MSFGSEVGFTTWLDKQHHDYHRTYIILLQDKIEYRSLFNGEYRGKN